MKKIKKTRSKMSKKLEFEQQMQLQAFMYKELEFGLDLSNNTIFLNSEISPDSLYEAVSRFNVVSKKIMETGNPKTDFITFNVSSFGGDVYSMFGIHDAMRNLKIKVNTLCIGPAMSAAAFLLASGTGIRTVTRNSTVMFHQFSSHMEGKTEDLVKNMGQIKKLQERVNELLASYTKKPKSFWEKETKEDLYLTAQECLDYGVVDKII